jgi:hypothetical protein
MDEAGLAYYSGKIKPWISSQPVKTIPPSLYPWTLTAKAGAVTCWPVGGTQLLPTVDFMFTEVPPASGDKGPENPSTISGVSEVNVTRCGKNLAELNRVYALPNRGITATVNTDGLVHVEGTSGASNPLVDIGNHDDSANKQLPYWMEVGKTYTLSFNSSNANGNPRVALYLSNSLTAWGADHTVYPGESYTFTVDNDKRRALIRISFDRNSTINCDCYIQIEEGSSATSFDGTIPEVYSLPLGNTYYGGSIDLATGLMTVTREGIVFDGSETLIVGGSATYYHYAFKIQNNASSVINNTTQTCSHLPLSNNLNDDILHFVCTPTQIHFFVPQATVSVFKTWLGQQKAAGTPLVVSYLLATPYTVQLSSTSLLSLAQTDKYTPRMDTIYTDASAVQVGYVKSPIREEYELTQAIVAQGGNI